jgi:ankyrin repeat protein
MSKVFLHEESNKKLSDGNTLLHLAITKGQEETVRQLLLNPKIKLTIEDNEGRTPLSLAKRLGYDKLINLLNNKIMELTLQLLKQVSSGKDIQAIKSLLESGADPFLRNVGNLKNGDNIFHAACQCQSLEVVKALLNEYPQLLRIKNTSVKPYPLLPVTLAIVNKKFPQVLPYLIAKSICDWQIKDDPQVVLFLYPKFPEPVRSRNLSQWLFKAEKVVISNETVAPSAAMNKK